MVTIDGSEFIYDPDQQLSNVDKIDGFLTHIAWREISQSHDAWADLLQNDVPTAAFAGAVGFG